MAGEEVRFKAHLEPKLALQQVPNALGVVDAACDSNRHVSTSPSALLRICCDLLVLHAGRQQ
jgi:hypothetical protein